MQRLLNTVLCTAALFTATCASASAATLTIEVGDLKLAGGNVMVAVYDSSGQFLKKPAVAGSAAAELTGNIVRFLDLPEGEYAVAVYHDANGNGKMDSNLMGIPTEDYAFSNNAVGKMAPPSYEQAKFALPAAGATVRLSLK